MDILQTLSNQLALSHQQLAWLMQTDRSNISKAISGHRSLPLAATVQMLEIYKAWQTLPAIETPAGMQQEDANEWNHCLAECSYQLQKLQRKMEAFNKQRNALIRRCLVLGKSGASNAISPSQKEWAGILRSEALRKLEAYSVFAWQRMQMQETLLLHEMELIKAIIKIKSHGRWPGNVCNRMRR